MERRIIKVDRRYCPHCQSYLSIKTFKAHRRLFFNEDTTSWSVQENDTEEENFSSPPRAVSYEDLIPCDDDSTGSPPPGFGGYLQIPYFLE